jgi:hypothetical protein
VQYVQMRQIVRRGLLHLGPLDGTGETSIAGLRARQIRAVVAEQEIVEACSRTFFCCLLTSKNVGLQRVQHIETCWVKPFLAITAKHAYRAAAFT